MNVAFIPVRGGSKSIPLKNIKSIAGKPLVYWTVQAAVACNQIDCVYVATDSEAIRTTVESFGFEKVRVIPRSAESATDTASTESAMLEFAQEYDFENIVLIQATSPLLSAENLDEGFKMFEKPEFDSVLSVVRQKRFVWNVSENGEARPVNYDVYNRPRRQEFDGYLVENGAFYICSRKDLLASKNRVSGRIGVVEMPETTYFEIDEPQDWIIIENLMERAQVKNAKKVNIKMVLTDCDGCLTDGGMYYGDDGSESKKFNTKDGMGFQLLREKGIKTGIITGENNDVVKCRGAKLKMDVVELGVKDKLARIRQIAKEQGVSLEEIAYIGDDINDLEVLKNVGLACSVQNAMPSVKAVADYVSPLCGGDGAVRDIIEYILKR